MANRIRKLQLVEKEGVIYKQCSGCGLQPLTRFGHLFKDRVGSDGRPFYTSQCVTCQRLRRDQFQPERKKLWMRRAVYKRHNLTIEQWEALFEKQGRCCAVCRSPVPRDTRGWQIDHDHSCCPSTNKNRTSCGKCVRGILCGGCNGALGQFNDDPTFLRAAAAYLEAYKKVSTWTHDRKQEQAEVARRVNEVENKKLSDYLCPDCGREFEQVTKGVYGGHRKACLHWKKAAEILEEEMGQTLDEILESNI